MLVVFLILIIILLLLLYYHLRVATSKLPKDVFRYYDFSQEKFMGRDIFIIKPLNHEDLYETSGNEKSEKVILYIHGGSYVGELEKYHWHFFKDIINDTKATIIVPDYPLTPENTYIEAFNMMQPLYEQIAKNIENKELILMGDSAGGGMALALYEQNGELGNRLPNKTILISPWLDVRMENPKIDNVDDPILKKSLLKLSGKRYAGKKGMSNYLVNPVLGPTDKLENIYFFSGTRDMLNPDAKEFALKNKEKITLLEYEDAVHNFVLLKHKKKNIHAKDGYKKVVDIILNKKEN